MSGNLLQTLNDPTVSDEDAFGWAVAAAGDYFVVGAYQHDIGSYEDIGQAHIFKNNFSEFPVFDNQTFSVAENSAEGTVVGTLAVTDADGDSLTYSIIANIDPDSDGNEAFRIEGDQLLVNDSGDFDYETGPELIVTAEVTDAGLTDMARITVNISDLNDAPVFNDQRVTVAANSAEGTVVGTLAATDADGDSLTYSIAANIDTNSDGNEAFRIEGDQLLINDAYDFEYEIDTRLVIAAEASDGSLSDTATVTVTVSVSGSIIVDDSDSEFTVSPNWYADGPAGYGGNASYWIWTQAHDASRPEAIWQASAQGEFEVAASWVGTEGYSESATYEIYDGSTLLGSVVVNQSEDPDDDYLIDGSKFQILGDSWLISGEQIRVILSNVTGAYSEKVMADAIRFMPAIETIPTLSVVIADDSIAEDDGAAATTATVTRSDSTTGDLVVNLASDDTSEVTVPSSVTIFDGNSSASFDIAAVDDSDVDGTQTVTVTASATGFTSSTDTVDVIDDETATAIILDDGEAGFVENGFTEQSDAQVAAAYDGDVHHMQGGSGEASWTFTGLPADHYQVAATWAYKYNNNYNATDAPFTLSDAAGGVFSTQIVNQKLTPSEFEDAGYYWDTLDTVEVTGGTLVVTLGAGSLSNNWVVADAIRVSVAPTLTVAIADAAVVESAGAAATTATVTRNGSTDADLVVSLASGDATEVLVPATVTIPAGQASTAFSIDAVDDSFFDGTQSVSVLATAIGFSDGSDSLEILDDDSAHTPP